MKIQQKCDWLFVFYIQEEQTLSIILNRLFDTLCQAGNKPAHSIWVIRQKIVTEDGIKGRFIPDVQTFDADGDPSALVSVPMELMGTHADDPDAWIAALRYILTNVIHSRKAIFTWSHGCGFGVNVSDYEIAKSLRHELARFPDKIDRRGGITETVPRHILLNAQQFDQISDPHRRFLLENKNLKPLPTDKKLQRNEFYIVERGENFDCGKLELLWMSDFAKALEDLNLEKPFDLMIMINCYMQLFENGYMLRRSVDTLIGPETTMWAYGYDYGKIFGYVEENPGIDTAALSQKIVADYIAMHTNMGHQQYLTETMLFANKLDKYELINKELQYTTEEICNRIDELKPVINGLRDIPYFKTVSRRGGLFLLDLELWIKTLYEKQLLLNSDTARLDAFLELKKKSRIAEHVGAEIISADNAGPENSVMEAARFSFRQVSR
ncbi:MAG: clostripain-related cysteine peptidase [Chitinophagaceae bacterium]